MSQSMRTARLLPAVLALSFAALALLACGNDEGGGGETVTVTERTVTETTAGSETTTTEDGAPPAADLEVAELTFFQSPTGNIGCVIDPESVRCDIGERDWKPTPRPAGCDLDYGQGISLAAGGAPRFVCAGDTVLGAGEQLAYGSSIAAGLLRCESGTEGMTCRDVESGRGFMIAREGYELF